MLFLLSKTLPAQLPTKLSVVDNWIQKSEQVVLTDSVLYEIRQESKQKQIPDKIMNKNMIYFRMLFNPQFSKKEQNSIADYILEVFSGYDNQFATELVRRTKAHLQKP